MRCVRRVRRDHIGCFHIETSFEAREAPARAPPLCLRNLDERVGGFRVTLVRRMKSDCLHVKRTDTPSLPRGVAYVVCAVSVACVARQSRAVSKDHRRTPATARNVVTKRSRTGDRPPTFHTANKDMLTERSRTAR